MIAKLPVLMGENLRHREGDSQKRIRKKEVNENSFEKFLNERNLNERNKNISDNKEITKADNIDEKIDENKKRRKVGKRNLENNRDNEKKGIDEINKRELKKERIKAFEKKIEAVTKNDSSKNISKLKNKKDKKKKKTIQNNEVVLTANSSLFVVGKYLKINTDALKEVNVEGKKKIEIITKNGKNINKKFNVKDGKKVLEELEKIQIKHDSSESKKGEIFKDGLNKSKYDKIDIEAIKKSLAGEGKEKLINIKDKLKEFAIKENLEQVFKPPFSDNPQIRDLSLYISKELKTNFNLLQNQLFDIFNNIKIKNINGNYFVSMKLFPQDLGKIDIYLKKVNGHIEGSIIVQSETIKSLIDGRIWEMKSLLSNSNLNGQNNLPNINVVVDNSGNQNQQNQFFKMKDYNMAISENSDDIDSSYNFSIENTVLNNIVGASYLGRKINYYL